MSKSLATVIAILCILFILAITYTTYLESKADGNKNVVVCVDCYHKEEAK